MPSHEFDFEQPEHLRRVSGKIGDAVLAFCRDHREFHGDELCDYVRRTCGGSAESARRIMRDLRQQGRLAYENTDRRNSVYRIVAVS